MCCERAPPSAERVTLCRCWAGLNKLLSPRFVREGGAWMLHGVWAAPPPRLERNAGLFIGLGELAVGALCAGPRTRRAGVRRSHSKARAV